MGTSYRWDGGVLALNYADPYSFEETSRAIDAALADPSGPRRADLLGDFRFVLTNPTADHICARIAFLKGRAGRLTGRWAIVAHDALRFGIGRMIQGFGDLDGVDVRVFRDEIEARKWLQG